MDSAHKYSSASVHCEIGSVATLVQLFGITEVMAFAFGKILAHGAIPTDVWYGGSMTSTKPSTIPIPWIWSVWPPAHCWRPARIGWSCVPKLQLVQFSTATRIACK